MRTTDQSVNSNAVRKSFGVLLLCAPLLLAAAPLTQAKSSLSPTSTEQVKPTPGPTLKPSVDLVLALDISGSMSGLIDSAKQRLWDVVNELGQAQPTPLLRVAIITFGTPAYGAESGYVRVNQALTSDLDAVNKTLFSFQTAGGDEYVARAIQTALTDLQWSTASNASKVIFVAGNESASQDPQYSLAAVAEQARAQGLVVNAVFCGNTQSRDAASWASVAQLGGGMYAAIDQQAGAIAQVSTPMDKQIARLNNELNTTYLAYGAKGKAASANQQEQDRNSRSMSEAALVSRTVTKAGKLYRNESWDLIDALEAGTELEEIAEQDLPKSLQTLTTTEQHQYLAEKKQQRKVLKEEISRLGSARQDYIKAKAPATESVSLDSVLKAGLQKAIAAQGLKLATKPTPKPKAE